MLGLCTSTPFTFTHILLLSVHAVRRYSGATCENSASYSTLNKIIWKYLFIYLNLCLLDR